MAALFPNNIPTEVFHNLIETFRENLPTWHRYWALRRKALGVEKLHPYDVWSPLADISLDIPFEQAVDWIAEGLRPMGDEYVAVLRRGCLEDRWVDRYPNTGKRQGAFSSGAKGTYPFIMMHYNGSLNSVSTLAHELGHSMHSWQTWQTQPRDLFATIRSLWRKSRPISTRRWCALTCSNPIPIRPSRSP